MRILKIGDLSLVMVFGGCLGFKWHLQDHEVLVYQNCLDLEQAIYPTDQLTFSMTD